VEGLQSSFDMRAGVTADPDLAGSITARMDTAPAAEAGALGRDIVRVRHASREQRASEPKTSTM
jgi:hypothetical protein